MVYIGLVSYSLYLWHWPLIAGTRYAGIAIDVPVTIALFVLALMLSWLTWKFVETPFRRNGALGSFARVLVCRLLLPVSQFALLADVTLHRNGFPERVDPLVVAFERISMTLPIELRADCHMPNALFETPASTHCRFGAADAPLDGILLSDSHANHFTGMLDEIGKAQHLALIDYTMDACPPLPGCTTPGWPAYAEKCRARNKSAFAHVETAHYLRVFLAEQWPTDESTAALLEAAVTRIERTGARRRHPAHTTIPGAATCPLRARMYVITRDCSAPQESRPAWWSALQTRLPCIVFLDPALVLCHDGHCYPVLDDLPAYRRRGPPERRRQQATRAGNQPPYAISKEPLNNLPPVAPAKTGDQ